MASTKLIGGIVALALAGSAAATAAVAWRPAIAPVDRPALRAFDQQLIKRGRDLAAIGNCSDCHTKRGGASYAGGLPVPTPFGTIYSSNITPDPDSGIGRWSEAAFIRAMRDGVDREGHHLYPTFPYDHFTNVTDDDNKALYAFMMTRQPVKAETPANKLAFPLNQRFTVAGWKLLFLRHANFRPDPAQSVERNRGAYLVEGLAHCGACHTPRNLLGAEKTSARFAGGEADDWDAFAINHQSPSPVPWDKDALFTYLRQGWHPDHGTARGPMAQVVSNLSTVDESDVRAIATYVADVFGAPSPDRQKRGQELVVSAKRTETQGSARDILSNPNSTGADGAAVYAAACAGCHETGRALPYGGVNLSLSTAITTSDPRNLINIVLSGIRPVQGERSPIMPGFADSMSDNQIATLVEYLRQRFGQQPVWSGVPKAVQEARRSQTQFVQTSAGPRNAPAEPTQRDKP